MTENYENMKTYKWKSNFENRKNILGGNDQTLKKQRERRFFAGIGIKDSFELTRATKTI